MKSRFQLERLAPQPQGVDWFPERQEGERYLLQTGIPVCLHLARRDRVLDDRSAIVHDRLIRVLPSLILQPPRGMCLVFEKTIAIAVAIPIKPVNDTPRGRYERARRIAVIRPREVLTDHDEEVLRGGIIAVVPAKWVDVEHRERPRAGLVDDFARLLIPPVIEFAVFST